MRRFTRFFLCIFALSGLWGCGSSRKEAHIATPAPTPPPAATPAEQSDADRVIDEARQHFFTGERELNLGHLEKAKEDFDSSLDVLMTYQEGHEPNAQVQAVIDELENKIFEHEMAALKEGDGFTERPLEPALIDELKNINTFPTPDQATKTEVEEELKTATYDIPVEVNDTVLSFIRIFQNARRKEFVGGLVRSGRYLPIMKQIFREEGLPEDLAYTALIESSFKSNAYSHARAKGFWQFISGTARRYDLKMDWWVDERSDFEKSTRAAARYLKDLHDMFNGDWYLALAGYNAGENTILNGMKRTTATNFWELSETRYLRQETKNYVPAILASMIIAKDPQKYGFNEAPETPLQFDRVTVDYPLDLRLIAECTGATLEEVKLLNPELIRLTTPARVSSYEIRIPSGKKDTFLAEVATVPVDKRVTWRKHEVKPGDTLTSIASIYRTSVNSIAQVNSLETGETLGVGQRLVIPIGRTPTVSYSSAPNLGPGAKSYYTVHQGDTLFRIATKTGTSVDRICELNGMSSRQQLKVGQRLVVRYSEPSPEVVKTASVQKSSSSGKKIVYQVKKGDTLFQIASNYNTDVDSIKKWNNLRNQQIFPGDHLTIYQK